MRHQAYYGLDEKPCSQEEAMDLFRSDKRIIGNTDIGEVTVSTVFLVIDHDFLGESPVLYETMIFGGEHDQYQQRYRSREAAVLGHEMACNLVREAA